MTRFFFKTTTTLFLFHYPLLADFTWIGTSSGNWSTGSNWTPLGPPNDSNQFVYFENVAAAGPIAVNVDGSFSVAGLIFNATTPNYQLMGAGSILINHAVDIFTAPANVNLTAGELSLACTISYTFDTSGLSFSNTSAFPIHYAGATLLDTNGQSIQFFDGIHDLVGCTVQPGLSLLYMAGAELQFNSITNLGTNPAQFQCGVGGSLHLVGSGFNPIYNTDIKLFAGFPMTFEIDGGSSLTLQGTFADIGGSNAIFLKTGDGTLILQSTNSCQGNMAFNGGIFQISSLSNLSAGTLGFNGGTLQITAPLTISKITTLNSGGGTIDTNGNALTLSQSIGGVGQLTKTGTSTLTLTASNNYTGGTTINNGTLALSGSGALSSTGAFNLASSSSIFDIQSATSSITIGALTGAVGSSIQLGAKSLSTSSSSSTLFAGSITGVGGSFALQGSGTLTLSGTNSYSGGTTINNNGTLALSGSGSLLSTGALTLSAVGSTFAIQAATSPVAIGDLSGVTGSLITLGTQSLTVNSSSTTTFSGAISGTGSFTKEGSGTLSLFGTNTYSGGTAIKAGSLIGNTNSLQGTLQNKGALTFEQSSTGTFTGTITSFGGIFGTLAKTGSGTLNLSSASLAYSLFTIENGVVNIDPAVTLSGPITVSTGATLGGEGPVSGNVIVNGTLIAGSPTGLLFVDGTYLQKASSFFQVSITPSAFSLLFTTGSSTIESGATLIFNPQAGNYPPNQSYTVLFAQGGLSGAQFILQNNLPAFQVSLKYFTSALAISFNIQPFHTFVTSGNAAKVAACLDSATVVDGSDLAEIIDDLRFMTMPQLLTSLNQMQPSLFNGFTISQEETAVGVHSSLARRLNNAHFGKCSGNAPWHIWIEPTTGRSHERDLKQEPGFKTSDESVVGGVDYFFSPRGYLGFFAGWTRDKIRWNENRGKGSTNGLYEGIYGGWKTSRFYAQAAATTSFNLYEATRDMRLIGIQEILIERSARHKSRGFGASSYLETGAVLGKRINIRPFVRSDYVFISRRGFTEHGAGSLDLRVKPYLADFMRLEEGIEISKCLPFQKITWVPHIKLGWVLERRFRGAHTQASFIDQSCVFKVRGMNPNRNLLAPAFGLTAKTLDDLLLLSIDYEAERSPHYYEFTWAAKAQFNF